MAKSREVSGATSMRAEDAAALAELCLDLAKWPEAWQADESDIAPGERIVECLIPFLLHLLSEGLATKTLRRHRDHVCMLGGEIIRRRYDESKLKKMSASKSIEELVHPDGGPLISPRITEEAQDSFDATCRKLYKYLNSASKPAR